CRFGPPGRGIAAAAGGEPPAEDGTGHFKKSDGLLREGIAMRDAFIEEHRTTWPIAVQCRVLEVTRSGYYAWRQRPPSATACRREELTEAVRRVHQGRRQVYGSPRVHAELA